MKNSILVIDDDESIRFILKHILQQDYIVETRENGYQGLIYLQEGNIPDLIILDLVMPEVNGFEFLENIKKSNYFNSIPVIVLSAKENSEEKIKCLKLGADDYIVKPFNPEELRLRTLSLFRRAKLI